MIKQRLAKHAAKSQTKLKARLEQTAVRDQDIDRQISKECSADKQVRQNLAERLKQGALAKAERDQQITKDWSAADQGAPTPRKSPAMRRKQSRITVALPTSVLKDVAWLAPLEDMTRDELILEAVTRFLKPHLEIRKQVIKPHKGKTYGPFDTPEEMVAFLRAEVRKRGKVTKAISESTKDLKTGRYEGPEE